MENKKEIDKMENQIKTVKEEKDTFEIEKVSTEKCESTGE